MSDKVKKDMQNLIDHLDAKLFKVQANSFDQLVELSEDLTSQNEISIIAAKRYRNFETAYQDQGYTRQELSTGFHYSERKMVKQIYERYEKSKSPKGLRIKKRCYTYLKYTEKFNPFEEIKDTFQWYGKSDNDIKNELSILYAGLRGVNKKRLFLISANTSENDFVKLMTGHSIDEKVQWMETRNLFIYFIDEIASTYLNLPDSIENNFKDDTSKRKALMDWLNPKIIACFQDSKGKDFKPKQLTSLRSKLDLSKLKHREVIDELFSKLHED